MSYAETISQALDRASTLLLGVTDNPRLESELLLANVLKTSRVYLLAHPETLLQEKQTHQYTMDIGRRMNNEPLPYITGTKEFCGMLFRVTPDVLIPRPETEQIVELASAWLERRPGAVVLDVGTGSGCIAVALTRHAKFHYIYATDISLAALQVAQQNAVRHHVLDKIGFVNCNLVRPIRRQVDIIVSNPPYIAARDYTGLPLSIHCEPRTALIAGNDGLQIIRRLLNQANRILDSNGLMLVEIGAQQRKAALTIAKATFPNASIRILNDLAGLDRILYIQCRARGLFAIHGL